MQLGLMVPQGWKGEYDGWRPEEAWARSVELAEHADTLGVESLWVFDHFHTVPVPEDEITFESFSMLAAIAMVTLRARLGHMVVCTGFRNPGLTAKMSSTIDVISGGRFELGIGAGWKEDEWRAYGYGFPPLADRLDALGDHLEVITRMFMPGRATYAGPHASVRGAINEPRGLQEHLENARIRCEEEGRDPATLKISLYCKDASVREAGQARVDFLGQLGELGLSRLIAFPTRWDPSRAAQASFVEDWLAAALPLIDARIDLPVAGEA
jgi:hypothetical protein